MRRLLIGIAAAVLSTTLVSHAQSPTGRAESLSGAAQLWFVELSSPPGIKGTAGNLLDRDEATFDQAVRESGISYRKGRRFRDLFNGVTVKVTGRDVNTLRGLPGVRAVYPVVKIARAQEPETPQGPVADLITAVKQTGVDIAQSELGLTGRGVTVAVIDSGIDYDHPDLGGCFGRGCRVEKGYDLVGDDFDADDDEPIIAPDRFPDDCDGHGTHVAGIVGANGGITGVAPEVTFHAYRVFGCEGPTTSDIMLDAMERALRDGADVVNMSIGSALQWPQYPTAKAADRLVRRGIVVVASAGNEGALGLYASSAPGAAKDVISVASFDNTASNLLGFSITPDDTKIGYIAAEGAPVPPTSGSAPIVRTGTTSSTADACNPLPANSLAGSVALIRRGSCSFNQKAFNAQTAGALAMILYNNAPGFVAATVVGPPEITIPVVSISADRGALIDGRLADTGSVTLTWTDVVVSEPNPTGNLISSFSSFGPAPDLSLKPDLGAPGGTVRSTLPLELGGYGNLSGTSMASPHVAGAVALLLEAHPGLSPAEVQARLQNSARPHLWTGDPTLGFLDNVHRQGAGMLRIDDAALTDAVVTPSSLALGEIESGSSTQWLKLSLDRARPRDQGRRGKRRGDDPITYRLGHEPALSTGPNTFTPQFLSSSATVTFSTTAVTVGRRNVNDALIGVKITPPASPNARLFGGYITLTPSDGSPVLRVPYLGYNGDYQAIPVLFTLAGLPQLAELTPSGILLLPGGGTFTMTSFDVPSLLIHLDHQVADLKMEVINVATGRSLNFADDEEFLPRNSAANSFFLFSWDGTTFRRPGGRLRTVPNGTYRIELSLLKALGDPNNPAHVEHWTSPNITIARPPAP